MNRKYFVIIVSLLVIVFIGILLQRRQESGVLTEQMRRELGAAAYLPENTAIYSSTKHLVPRVKRMWQSNAMQSLYNLPTVRIGMSLLTAREPFQMGMAKIDGLPLIAEGKPILADAMSNEVFMWASEDFARLIKSVQEMSNSVRMIALRQDLMGEDEPSAEVEAKLLDEVLALLTTYREDLKVPACMVGFKLTDSAAATQFLDKWISELNGKLNGKIKQETVKDSSFYVLRLSGADIPAEALEKMKSELPEERQKVVLDLIDSQRLTVAIGLLDDYLLISMGPDTSVLENWGATSSLAASDAFEPLRRRFRSSITDVRYLSSETMSAVGWGAPDVEKFSQAGKMMLAKMPASELKTQLEPRISQDLEKLGKDWAAIMPEPRSVLNFSCNPEGTEQYTIWSGADLEMGQLTMLKHVGENSIFASACYSAGAVDFYTMATKWIRVVYGYVQDIAVAEMSAEEQTNFKLAESLMLPFFKQIDETNRNLLFPALAGSQSMAVLDGGGEVRELAVPAGPAMTFNDPVPVPRMGLAVSLNDADAFREAIGEYYDAVQTLLAEAKEIEKLPSEMKELSLPDFLVEELADGQLYYYAWPWSGGEDLFPCAMIKDRFLYLGTSKSLAAELVIGNAAPVDPIVDLSRPAASARLMKFGPLWTYLGNLNRSALSLVKEKIGNNPALVMEQMHVDALLRSLGAFKSYTSVTRVEDDGVVKHSHLDVQDID